ETWPPRLPFLRRSRDRTRGRVPSGPAPTPDGQSPRTRSLVSRSERRAMLTAAARAVAAIILCGIGRSSACRACDGESGGLADVALEAQRDLPGTPDQRVAGGEPGRGRGRHAVTRDVHHLMRALDPQPPRPVHPDLGDAGEVKDLLEVDLVGPAGELVHPHLPVRRAVVD